MFLGIGPREAGTLLYWQMLQGLLDMLCWPLASSLPRSECLFSDKPLYLAKVQARGLLQREGATSSPLRGKLWSHYPDKSTLSLKRSYVLQLTTCMMKGIADVSSSFWTMDVTLLSG